MAHSNIKIGTRVRIIEATGGLKKGDVYIIASPSTDSDGDYKAYSEEECMDDEYHSHTYVNEDLFEVIDSKDGSEITIVHASLPVFKDDSQLEPGDVILSPQLQVGIVLSRRENSADAPQDVYTIINTGINTEREHRGNIGTATDEFLRERDNRVLQNVFDIYSTLPFGKRERLG